MSASDDETTFEAEVRAMLRRRAEDIGPDPSGQGLPAPDAAGAAALTEVSLRTRWMVAGVACLLLFVGLAVAASREDGQQTVVANSTPTSTPATAPTTDPVEPDSTATDPPPDTTGEVLVPDPSTTTTSVPPTGEPHRPTSTSPPGPDQTGGGALPVVAFHPTPTGMGPQRTSYRDCSGDIQTNVNSGMIRIDRSGPLGDPVAVDIAVTGDLVAALEPSPTATIAAGEDMTLASLHVDDLRAGQVTLTIQPGPGHQVGDPASQTFTFPAMTITHDCNEPIPVSPSATQTIDVGQKPQDLVFAASEYGPNSAYPDPSALPPGLDLAPDTGPHDPVSRGVWSGTATTPGTYRFPVRHCYTSPFFIPQAEMTCLGTTWLTIIVRAP